MSQQINLFNPIFLRRKQPFRARQMAVLLGVLVIGAIAVSVFGYVQNQPLEREAAQMEATLAARKTRLAAVKVEFAPRASDPTLKSQLERTELKLHSMQQVERIVSEGDAGGLQGYGEYFKALARQSVSGLWLTEVAVHGSGSDISLQGRVMQASLLPRYMARLADEPVLRGKAFGQLEIGKPGMMETAPGLSTTPPGAGASTAAQGTPEPRFLEFRLRSGSAEPAAGAATTPPGGKP
jgi:hypothetical protein